MTVPNQPDPGGQRADAPVVRTAPLVTWQEPALLAYRLVELPAENGARGQAPLPPLEFVSRPNFADVPDIATPQEKEEAAYRLAGTLEEDLAKVHHRQYQEERLEELVAYARKIRRQTRRFGTIREKYWFQCLALPLMAWRLLLGLAAGLSLATVWVLPLEGNNVLPWHLRLLVPLILVVYVCGFLQCVLNGAVAGDPPMVTWPGRQLTLALRYTGWWLFCFLAGPAPLGIAALGYWIYCGDLEVLDWLILLQAGVMAVGYWLFALLAVTRTGRIYNANPLQIAALIRCLGYRAGVAVLIAFLLVFEHARLILIGIGVAHENGFSGWFVLTLYWLSALAAMTFLLRLVGWWYYCRR